MKLLALALAVVVPGGLVLLGAWVLARLVAQHMRQLPPAPYVVRLARAVGAVRPGEVTAELRRALAA